MRSHADTHPAGSSISRLSAHTAALLAFAVVLGVVESALVPPIPVPGVKLGLANLAVIIALAQLGPARAAFVSLGRVVLVALAVGTLGGPGFFMSFAGAAASLIAMSALARFCPSCTPVGWSVAGAAAHVVAQLAAASLLISSSAPFALAPLSLALSLPLGLALGYLAALLISRLPELSLSAAGR